MKTVHKAALMVTAFVLFLSVTACTDTSYVANTPNGNISAGIYIMMLNDAFGEASNHADFNSTLSNPLENQIEGQSVEQWVQERAEQTLRTFVGVDTLFDEMALSLDEQTIQEIETQVNTAWDSNAADYEAAGISKNSLRQVQTNNRKRTALFEAHYDVDGMKEVPEQDIRDHFKNEYISYQQMSFPLINWSTFTMLSEEESAKVKEQAEKYLERAKNGEDFEKLIRENNERLAQENQTSSDSADTTERSLLKKSDATEGVAKEIVDKANIGEPLLLVDTYSYYIIMRHDVFDLEQTFEDARMTVLYDMKQDEFESILLERGNAVDITFNQAARKRYSLSDLIKRSSS